MTGNPHVLDSGTIFQITILNSKSQIVDLSSMNVLQLAFYDPAGNYSVKQAGLSTDGKDGNMQYIIQSGDFSLAGTYRVQAFMQNVSGSWSSSTQSFKVAKNLYQP